MGELAAFLGIAILVIVTPGQDTALTIRNTMLGGRAAGVATAAGVAAGQACWTAAASIGLAALLVASEPVFVALKLAGAAYLVFLGLQALHHALRPGTRSVERSDGPVARCAARVSPGPPEQPRQPKDGDLLHQPAAPVRELVREPARVGTFLLRAHVRLAGRVLVRDRPRGRPVAATSDSTLARRFHRDVPRGLRNPARCRAMTLLRWPDGHSPDEARRRRASRAQR